jgi:hypothetical protein
MGPYSGKLDNAGETIELWRPDPPQSPSSPDAGFVPQILVERVAYDEDAPWPTYADGAGASLQRLIAAHYGNDPVNWKAALPTAGRANILAPLGTATATLPGGGIVRLAFLVESGRTYQVEYKNALTDPDWLPLGSPIPVAGDTLTVDDDLTGQPQRFYRLTVLP